MIKLRLGSRLAVVAGFAVLAGSSLIGSPAKANVACQLSAWAAGTCALTEGDKQVTPVGNSANTLGSYAPNSLDSISLNAVDADTYQIQFSFNPAQNNPASATFQYTVDILNPQLSQGWTLGDYYANITGSGGYSIFTLASGSGVPSTSTGGNGNTVVFSSGVTSSTFQQSWTSSTGGSVSSFGITLNQKSPNAAPGPLPILGAGAAFGFSRKLRRRIKEVA